MMCKDNCSKRTAHEISFRRSNACTNIISIVAAILCLPILVLSEAKSSNISTTRNHYLRSSFENIHRSSQGDTILLKPKKGITHEDVQKRIISEESSTKNQHGRKIYQISQIGSKMKSKGKALKDKKYSTISPSAQLHMNAELGDRFKSGSGFPTTSPSTQPTIVHSEYPSQIPSPLPTIRMTEKPSETMSNAPSKVPTKNPTLNPTLEPTSILFFHVNPIDPFSIEMTVNPDNLANIGIWKVFEKTITSYISLYFATALEVEHGPDDPIAKSLSIRIVQAETRRHLDDGADLEVKYTLVGSTFYRSHSAENSEYMEELLNSLFRDYESIEGFLTHLDNSGIDSSSVSFKRVTIARDQRTFPNSFDTSMPADDGTRYSTISILVAAISVLMVATLARGASQKWKKRQLRVDSGATKKSKKWYSGAFSDHHSLSLSETALSDCTSSDSSSSEDPENMDNAIKETYFDLIWAPSKDMAQSLKGQKRRSFVQRTRSGRRPLRNNKRSLISQVYEKNWSPIGLTTIPETEERSIADSSLFRSSDAEEDTNENTYETESGIEIYQTMSYGDEKKIGMEAENKEWIMHGSVRESISRSPPNVELVTIDIDADEWCSVSHLNQLSTPLSRIPVHGTRISI